MKKVTFVLCCLTTLTLTIQKAIATDFEQALVLAQEFEKQLSDRQKQLAEQHEAIMKELHAQCTATPILYTQTTHDQITREYKKVIRTLLSLNKKLATMPKLGFVDVFCSKIEQLLELLNHHYDEAVAVSDQDGIKTYTTYREALLLMKRDVVVLKDRVIALNTVP